MEATKKQTAKGWLIAAAACVLVLAGGVILLTARAGEQRSDIGEVQAKSIVLTHAGVAEADLSAYRCAMDTDSGKTVYQLDFSAGEYDYAYAVTGKGEIVGFEKELNPAALTGGTAEPPAPVSPAETMDGLAKAKEIALAHAGLSEDELTDYTFALNVKNGIQCYELVFASGDLKYEYEIDPAAGTVLKAETEQFDAVQPPPVQESQPAASSGTAAAPAPSGAQGGSSSALIGEAQAKSIALNHAGAAEADIFSYVCKLDWEDGVQVYEVEFKCGSYEYEYDIHAANGSILKSDKEWDDNAQSASQGGALTASSESYIGEARAQEIAFSHAGLSAGSVTHCGVELDHDGHHHGGGHHGSNCCVYEVDFHCGGYEYGYKIDARTGAVLAYEQELDD